MVTFIVFIHTLSVANNKPTKLISGGEIAFTVRTVTAGGTYAPKHVLAIWVEDADGFVKTRKAMANQRKQYLYTWKAASNYNVVDAITGATLTSHQTHTVSWDCKDLDGEIVPDGEYTIWVEFTEKHAQGPLYQLIFTKGPNSQLISPPDETYFKDIELVYTPYIADFSYDNTVICQWETVTFTDQSVNAVSWEWNFGNGAAPATSSTQGPHTVYYTTPGSKTVSLTINGSLTEIKEDIVTVNPQPEAEFTYAGTGLTIDFTNNTTDAESYLWDFGDGYSSTENNPTHTYAISGTYNVTLTATNSECEDSFSQEISIPLTGILYSSGNHHFDIFPNPNDGKFEIRFDHTNVPDVIRVFDHSGEVVISLVSFDSSATSVLMDLGKNSSGIYYILIESKEWSKVEKLIIK